MSEPLRDAQWEGSVLAHFDAADLLDAVSLGIVVLDAQLCTVYANTIAEDILALPADGLRGQPLTWFLPQPPRFLQAVNRALETKEAVTFDLTDCGRCRPGPEGTLNLKVTPLRAQSTGLHLLLEVSTRELVGCGLAAAAATSPPERV